MGPLDLFIELPQLARRGLNDLHNVRAQKSALLARGERMQIYQEWLPLCRAQFNISGLRKRIMRELLLNGLIHTQLIDEARAAHARQRRRESEISRIAALSGSRQGSSGWWSQRDLTPCFNAISTSPLLLRGFERVLQVGKGCD
jgi:hypothetical protein